MDRPPLAATVALLIASLWWAGLLVTIDGELAASSATLLAIEIVLLATITAAGTMVGRARWSRRMAWVVTALCGVSAILIPIGWAWLVGLGLAAVALGLTFSPTLTAWLSGGRRDGPPAGAVVLTLGLLGVPAVVALAAPDGLDGVSTVVSVVGWLLAFGYARAWMPALWAIRLLAPTGALALVAASGIPGLVPGAALSALAWLSWTPPIRLAVTRPASHTATAFPIPPELAPREVLDAAGRDPSGRRRDPSGGS